MKRITIVVFGIVLTALMGSISYAHSVQSTDEITSRLLSEQDIQSIKELDCNKVSSHDFEEYGDAIMEEMHPGEIHEIMDEMAGGEGSYSLQQMHILMGMRWLGCTDSGTSYGIIPMMGWGGMGNMMGTQYGYWSLLNVLYVILLIGLIILVYFWIAKLWKNKVRKGRK